MARPKDDEKRKIGSKGRGILHFILDADHWDYREETGNDYGRDCVLELSENDEWFNHKVEGQIKSTASPKLVGDEVSFPMPVKTIEYALGTSISFILFVVDTTNKDAYYQCVQQYFIDHKELFDRLDQQTINIHIPIFQKVSEGDERLQNWARATFIDGPGKELKLYVNQSGVENLLDDLGA